MERILSKRKQLANAAAAASEHKANEMMKREAKGEPTDPGKCSRNGSVVIDPVTGYQTAIHHSPNESELDSGTNVLQIPLPQPDLAGQKGYLLYLFSVTLMRLGTAYLLIPVLIFLISPAWLTSRPLLLLSLSFIPPFLITVFLLHRLQRHAHEHEDQQIWNMERQRGLQAGYDLNDDGKVDITERVRESAEWFNALLRGVWPIINPDLFTGAVDMIEDIMQASVPKFIHSVRIGDIGQGTNPIRITSIRSLPDADLSEVMQDLDTGDRELIQGDHVNVEVSFAYRANPATSRKASRAVNAHLLIEFFVGLRGLIGVPVPVWAEITGIVGTARIRAELIPDPPFVKHTLVTLMGLPKISLSITPLHKKMLPNIMDIPFLSDFISKSINLAAQEYVAPKSLILDIQTLLSSDGIKRDSASVGVIIVHIHRCKDLKSTDCRTGRVDAYVSVCMSPMNKPQYSTRVIMSELNPVFEECTALLVDANAPKVKERVSLQVWDNDRFTGDDFVAQVEIDVAELVKNKNQAVWRSASLKRPMSQEHMGKIEYTIGFYAKVAPGSEDGSPDVPQVVLDNPDFARVKQKSMSDIEAAVMFTSPSRKWFSGILTIQIHEIRELGIKKDRSTLHARREDTIDFKQEDGAQEVEEDSDLPSGYCTVVLDDEPIYQTRTKPMTASPFFNASTERFVADWRSSNICLVVRDSRLREVDPILGMVYLKLSELFETSSQVTRTWSLQKGVGFGRIRASFCFRPVLARIPPALTGFEIGTLEVQSLIPHYNDRSLAESTQIRLRTSPRRQKLLRRVEADSKHTCDSPTENRSSASLSNFGSGDSEEEFSDHTVSLPVQKRYQSALLVTVKRNGLLQRGTVGMAVVWMKDLIDNRKQVVRAKIWKADDYGPLKRNYLPHWGIWEDPAQDVTCIGEVEMTLCFRPGVADVHKKSFSRDTNLKRTWEEYVALRGSDLRTNMGRKADEEYHDDHSDSNTVVHLEDMDTDGHDDTDCLPGSLRRRGRMGIDQVRDWRNHENDLTRVHRGIHHVKAARTADWMKDHLVEGLNTFQDRFKRHERTPRMGKETERN